ncbi:MAG: nucleoside-diphosphate sugar epimerase/dehydratase, partial [Candidatus Nealsonbacteria bacterium]|nr:nucleoside-diphosphate sugar epimerase/dehydratase [Candidatus Nealsonbacteria bacterium]
DAGEQAVRGIRNSREGYYLPIGFVDDNPSKKGITIHGLPVLGVLDQIPKIVGDEQVEELIIALPSAGKNTIKRAVDLGRRANIRKIKIIPSIADIISGEIVLGNLRDVSIEDLLGREPVKIDTKSIERFIKGKTVLITGAAGSIGSELSMQVAKFSPSQLILLDQDETGIFNICNRISKKLPQVKLNSVIADICDHPKIKKVFSQFKPAVVFHAAAYKHVPLMEDNTDEAVKNNVFGTKNVAEISLESGVEKFVFISTDKAVNPTSVMGATKRLGEMICQILNQKNGTKFISVRFGNVLDSRGSVIPIFREKILKREALEVTHPDMKRYFMMIPEACLLVMQAGQMGNGGEVFVLDMGEPIKIIDLAKEMIKLAGLEPDKDIPIVFSGIRPGEKLFEETLTAEEGTIATENQSIFKAMLSHIEEGALKEKLSALKNILENGSEKEKIIAILKEIIPVYKGVDI